MAAGRDVEFRIGEYWDWLAGALFLLITVDVLTTIYAAHVAGLGAEANPIVRWSLSRGPVVVVAVNLLAVVVTVMLFDRLLDRLRRTPAPFDRYFALAIELWLGLLLAVGLVVFANNLSVIVLGNGLL